MNKTMITFLYLQKVFMGNFMPEQLQGIVLNNKTISAFVGAFTLLSMLVGAVSFLTYQRFELIEMKKDVAELQVVMEASDADIIKRVQVADKQTRENYQMILDKFDALTREVTKLTIAVGNVQYRQDNTAASE